MQADPPDAAVPSSPPVSPFAQQTAARDNMRLRRPAVATHAPAPAVSPSLQPPGMIKLFLSLPSADIVPSAARAEFTVYTGTSVRDAKDAIASGAAGFGLWERTGLRLIWRGRVLADDEVLDTVFSGIEEPTVHVVARRVPGDAAPILAPRSAPRPRALPTPTTPNGTALADTVHYLCFVCREHMYLLVDREPLAWEDMRPPPTIPRAEAYKAILSVVRTYANEWADALHGDGDREALKRAWLDMGSEAMRDEISTLWRDLTGQEYGADGTSTAVEIDRETLTVHLPALKDMVPAQLTHLLFYLRTAGLVRYLSNHLAELNATEQPTPTPTAPQPTVPPQVMYQGSIRIRVPRLRLSFVLIQHLFWSAMRIITILWMLTRGMKWNDTRLWFLIAACAGWWLVDGFNHWLVENRQRREARMRRAAHAENLVRAQAGADIPPLDPAAQAAADAPLHAAAAARAGAGAIRPRAPPQGQPPRRRAQGTEVLLQIPYFNLDEDAAQVRVRSARLHGPAPRRVGTPTPQDPVAELLPEPQTRPSRIITNALLPAALWFVTLIPTFEAQRAREIRQRERSMRAVIKALNPETEEAADAGEGDVEAAAAVAAVGVETENADENENSHAPAAAPAAPRELVLPSGISPAARAYYLRVAASTESIDWEEERAAQRAMGIPDEDEGDGARAGFMGML